MQARVVWTALCRSESTSEGTLPDLAAFCKQMDARGRLILMTRVIAGGTSYAVIGQDCDDSMEAIGFADRMLNRLNSEEATREAAVTSFGYVQAIATHLVGEQVDYHQLLGMDHGLGLRLVQILGALRRIGKPGPPLTFRDVKKPEEPQEQPGES